MRPAAIVCHSVRLLCQPTWPPSSAHFLRTVGQWAQRPAPCWPRGRALHITIWPEIPGMVSVSSSWTLNSQTPVFWEITALRPGVEEELCEDDCGVHLTFAHSWEETNIPAWSEQGLQGAGPRGVGVCLGWGCEQVSSLQGDPAFPILPSTLARLVPSTPPSPRASRLPAAPSHTAPLQAPARPSTVLFFHLSSSVYSLTG